MLLHTINCAPNSQSIEDCGKALSAEDAIVLMGDGVYSGLADSLGGKKLLASGASLYAIETDVRAAGIEGNLDPAVTVIDYSGLVTLSEKFSRQVAWY